LTRRRGTPRRSFTARRTFYAVKKWDPQVIPRRFKKLERPRVEELVFESEMLDDLETLVFQVLTLNAIPGDQWEWYIRYSKRLWERAVKFSWETFRLEKISLVNEFIARGQDPAILSQIQVHAEVVGMLKHKLLPPSVWNYDNPVGTIFIHEWGPYDVRPSGAGYIAEPENGNGGYYDNRGGWIVLGEPQGVTGGSYDNRQ